MTIVTVDAARRERAVAACSFDVFDTFLLRACTTPDGVFERAYQRLSLSKAFPNVSESFIQHRIMAEARARRVAKNARGSSEVGIAEIYSFFPFRLFGLDRSALSDLVDAEFEAELELCRENPEMIQQYTDMKRRGYRTGFISDTYWSTDQLGRLLRACSPGLDWDFLYASCENGTSKSEALFARYLSEQQVDPATALHVGDNATADIKGAKRHGIRARYYPQASRALAAQLQRESSVFTLLCPGHSPRLDQGSRTLRRIVSAQTPEKSPAFRLGVTTLGPMMAAFDAFIDERAARLRQDKARKVAVAFLGRDGFLPHRIWQALHGDTASYLEINRRVSLIGSATTTAPLVKLLREIVKIDATAFGAIVKVLPPAVVAFFNQFPDGITSGKELAKALPHLIEEAQIRDLAAAVRASLLVYLRHTIPDFDTCTDLVLADLGYAGSVQKALRQIFDQEGIGIRIHGAYLMTLDDAFHDLDDNDTAEGLISDLIVTPHVKRMLGHNIALLEQICCSADGSVRDYRGGEVLREINPRPAEQLALAAKIQAGALAFVDRACEFSPRYGLHPFKAPDVMARWTAAILGRLLLLPDDDELLLLGTLKHDVNLGTQALAPMLDDAAIRHQLVAGGLLAACANPGPSMWIAGSFACLSPSHAFLYLLFGANRLPADVFGDIRCGDIQIGLFAANGSATMENVPCYRTGFGDIRIRIPVSSTMDVQTIAVPLATIAPEGLLHGVTVEAGTTIQTISKSLDVTALPDSKLTMAGLTVSGRHYRANDGDGCLLITVDPLKQPVAIFSVALTSLSGNRILALQDTDAAGPHTSVA
ncbi:HAD family hydrolase [Bradyrhizobium prioriisuperbiae]|uniref:HAD family hydrolase n=1 Tax=Bradyrhizobium prioriisuperbiae TaxID=2854389 RepID=UPI0028E30A33|nr:HAD family hydrolase [Bradyrhizobium prioritasuperba]